MNPPPDRLQAAQAPPGLGGEVLEEEGVHGALQPYMEFGDLTFSNCHQLHAGKCEVLVEGCHVLLVAGKAVEGLCDHDLELCVARVL